MSTESTLATGERADLLDTLAKHRFFFRNTLRELTDEQAGLRPTASALTLAGLVKHVTLMEQQWVDFILDGPGALDHRTPDGEPDYRRHARTFRPEPGETVTELLRRYDEAAARTSQVVSDLPDLDAAQLLPPAPWFAPGARWTARRVLLHIIAETSQHAGHADIIRESIDGAKSMG